MQSAQVKTTRIDSFIQKTQEEGFDAITRKESLLTIIEQKNREALRDWIWMHFGTWIPDVKVCPDHDAPFDFVADYIFGLYDFMIVLANRSGGKTMDFGILDTTMSWLQANTELAAVGAIQFQAQKGYEYFNDFSSKFPFDHNIESRTMRETKMRNKSKVQILTGTMSGVNSPHPQLLFLDEIDLMAWQVLQQAFSMPQSKNGVDSRTVLTSTRKFAAGAMQRMMNEAQAKGHKVYQWCIWEVIEKLPTNKAELEKIYKTFGSAIPKHIDKANGYYSWKDAIQKFGSLDAETWETEWLCKRPGLQGVIYGTSYSDDNNLITEFSPKDRGGYIYLFEDFGFGEGHPDVVLFVWIPREFDRLVVFDELYLQGYGTDDIWNAIDEKLQEYGMRLPDKLRGTAGSVTGWAADYHGLTEIEDRKSRGAPMMEKAEDSQLYGVTNGIAIVRRFFQSGRLMITEKCVNLRTEVLSYKKKKNLDGTYSQTPEKKNDHGPDALRYGLIPLHELILARIMSIMESELPETEEKKEKPVRKTTFVQNPEKIQGKKEENTIFGSMDSVKF